MSVCNFCGENSNAIVFVEFLNHFQVYQQFPLKTQKLEINGIEHRLQLNLVILKGYLNLGMLQGQATQTQDLSSPLPTQLPALPTILSFDRKLLLD